MARSTSRYLIALVACGGSSTPGGSHVGSAVAETPPPPTAVPCADAPALPDGKLAGFAPGSSRRSAPSTGAGAATIGVIADAGGAAPVTLAALGRLRAKLDAAHVDVVIALGGMGATQSDLEATLGALATGATWPLVAMPGDLEPAQANDAAVVALRGKGAPVIDGARAHAIELPGASIALLPGAGALDRLAAGSAGCGWRPSDVDALVHPLSGKPGVRVLAAFEAPRGTTGGEATGDLPTLPSAVDVVLAGAGDATPASSGGRDGAAVALSPGPSDATTRLAGPHVPTVGILAIHDGKWTWKTLADGP